MFSKSASSKGLVGWFIRGLAILLAVSLLASALPLPVSAASLAANDEDCKRSYEVKRGDTLRSIGRKFGVNANSIAEENEMDPPFTIYLGQRLCIPRRNISDARKVSSTRANAFAVYFTAGRSGNDILLYVYNYPKITVQLRGVNVGGGGWKSVDIARINLAHEGLRETLRFRLPSDLRVVHLLICLKSKSTGYLQCVVPRTGG